jgi:hypothetical protein
MTGQGLRHGWDLGGHRPTWEPGPFKGPFNRHEFFPTKGIDYRQKYYSGPSQTILQVKRSWAAVVTWSAVVRPVGCTAKFSKSTLEVAYGRDIHIEFSPAVIMQLHIPWTLDICDIVLCGLLLSPSTRCTCVMIMLFYQHLDMPHLSGGWIMLTKAEMLTNRDSNKFGHNIWEKYIFFCTWNIAGMFYFSSWNQHFTCVLYILVQFILVL